MQRSRTASFLIFSLAVAVRTSPPRTWRDIQLLSLTEAAGWITVTITLCDRTFPSGITYAYGKNATTFGRTSDISCA